VAVAAAATAAVVAILLLVILGVIWYRWQRASKNRSQGLSKHTEHDGEAGFSSIANSNDASDVRSVVEPKLSAVHEIDSKIKPTPRSVAKEQGIKDTKMGGRAGIGGGSCDPPNTKRTPFGSYQAPGTYVHPSLTARGSETGRLRVTPREALVHPMLAGDTSPKAATTSLSTVDEKDLSKHSLEVVREEAAPKEEAASKPVEALHRLPLAMPRQNTQFVQKNAAGENLKKLPSRMPRQETQFIVSAEEDYNPLTPSAPPNVAAVARSDPDLNA